MRLYPICLLLLSVVTVTACGPSREYVEQRHVITQHSALPAPGGPSQVGTMTPTGKYSVQGGVSRVAVVGAQTQTNNENLGHIMMHTTLNGALSYGHSDWLELRATGQFGTTRVSMPTSSFTPSRETIKFAHSFWGGLHGRALVIGDKMDGVAVLGGAQFGRVPFARHVHSITTQYGKTIDERESNERSAEIYTRFEGGIQGFFSPFENITLNAGGMMQSYPRFWARRTMTEVCEVVAGTITCENSPGALAPYKTIGIGTLFVGGSYITEGPLSVHGQLFYHTHAEQVIKRTASTGLDLHLRYTF